MFLDTPGVIPFDDNDEYIQGLLGVKDATHLDDPIGVAMRIVEKFRDENPKALEDVKSGGKKSKKAHGFLMGQVMQRTKGTANPQIVAKILGSKLKSPG